MAKHVKVGEKLEVVFAPAHRGVQTEELINGRRAFPVDSGPAPLAGDRWLVSVVGMNRTRTVYFVEPLEMVEAADGLGEVLKPYAPFYHEFIREAEASLRTFFPRPDNTEGNENGTPVGLPPQDDDLLAAILERGVLPEAYVDSCWDRYGS